MESEITKFEEVFCLCGKKIMNNLNLVDIKVIRLINKYLNNIVETYLCEDRDIRLNISDHNHNILWRPDSKLKYKISTLSITWMYGYENYIIIPDQFRNITKLLLTFDVGADFNTFDTLLSQLPNLKYFGFLFSMHTLNCEWWDTLDCYPNLETVELASNRKYIAHFNRGPLCNFFQKNPNIISIRISLSLWLNIWDALFARKISFKNFFLQWDDYYSFIFSETIDSFFLKWFEKKLYTEAYIEFYSEDEKSDKFYSDSQYIPGIKEIRSFKFSTNQELNETIPFITENNIIAKVVYNKSDWFHF